MHLDPTDQSIYSWQLDVPGLGASGQQILRNTTALVSRVGGLGGPLAQSLAAAGFGKIILAHGGPLRPDDLNRQILMTHEGLGKNRAKQAAATIERFTPRVETMAVESNINETNVESLVKQADIVFSCAPLFDERLLMNREAIHQNKLFVDSAMFNLEGQVLAVRPNQSTCLACITPTPPAGWKRRFPVIGAVSALIAQLGVLEGIKLLTGMAPANTDTLLHFSTQQSTLRKIKLTRNPECPHCGTHTHEQNTVTIP
ncbi:HesA/MoeB/ThiF family protein [Verrucomicrobiaceae bacterium N1E253]|uniref:HesA/MoeB/ThiF family protein n=1 Tax=Oceaniferula marina TaxID=2748318 RepID=A0A851GAE5_9BACT|nr:HesA/MoeB/ThiF family protein [Oceaniferula marina]NWK54366.1 HesA/MoeB/ThiF family protein [Oceaniferula marina]